MASAIALSLEDEQMARVVVIVEDAEDLAASLAIAVETIPNVQPIVTHRAKAALHTIAAGSRVAALVTDLNLPDASGLELIRDVRKLNGYEALPAILITAEEGTVAVNGNIMDAPNAIFRKPFSVREVLSVLESLLP